MLAFAQDAGKKQDDPPAAENKQPPADEAKPADTKPDETKPDETKPVTKPEDEGTPAEQFTKALGEWRDLETKIREARAEFLKAPVTERGPAYGKYNAVANQMVAALPKLREKAVAAYAAAPNDDEQVTRILIGLMADANRNDHYADAREIGDLLAAHNCSLNAYQGQYGAALFCLGEFEKAAPYLKVAAEDEKTQTELVKLALEEQNAREAETAADNLPRVRLTTSKGDVVLELFENEAPGTVGNFIHLVEQGFYKDMPFHRVLEGFMAQGGDPKGDGTGGPGYKIFCESYKEDHRSHFRGSLAMAHSGRDTGGSQFYITFIRTSHLDGLHTVFGRVVEGMEHVDALNRVDPQPPNPDVKPDMLIKAEVIRKRDHAYEPVKVPEPGATTTTPPKTDAPPKTDTPPKTDADPAKTDSDPAKTGTDPAKTDADPPKTNTDPAKTNTEPPKPDTDPAKPDEPKGGTP
jgi:cyclophilin family peptidyl-prolyl cis-trans isomerase